MPIEIKVVPTRMKRIDVIRVRPEWQEFLELSTNVELNNQSKSDSNFESTT